MASDLTVDLKSAWADCVQALRTQARVIMALVLRETLSRYGQQKLGFLWAFLEPLLMVAVFATIITAARSGNPGGIPLVLFMMTGFVPFMMFRDPMNQMQGAISANKSLIGFPQVTTFDVIVARAILECSVLLLVFPIILCLAHMFGHRIEVENPLGVLAACLLLASLGTGMGFLFAALTPILPSTRQISSTLLGRPLFFSSGLFFTADSIPPPVRDWLLYNPILHMLELLRSEFFHEFESPHGDWRYATFWSLGVLTLGMLVHQSLRRRAIVGL